MNSSSSCERLLYANATSVIRRSNHLRKWKQMRAAAGEKEDKMCSHSHTNPALYIPIPRTPPFESSPNCSAVSMEGGDEEDIIEPHTIGSGERVRNRIFERSKSYWVLVVSSILALIVGQAAATLLSRYYFDNGGNSRWLSTLLQCVGWPILLIPLLFYLRKKKGSSRLTTLTPKLYLIYLVLGLLIAADNLLYSWGVSFMPASTFSLLCSSQLAFNAVFAFLLNKEKITPSVLNSLVILIFSAVLLGVHSDSDRPEGVSTTEYIVGFFCTVAAAAMYGLILPLIQLVFQRVIKKEIFAAVLEMQIYTSIVATVVCIMGLFISRESEDMKKEASSFTTGKLAYYMTLIWSAIGWQVCSIGVVGLIFQVSSLFSNVISTLALPVVPILSVWLFHDSMNAIKIISMLLSIWGFVSYVYGGYVDSKSPTAPKNTTEEKSRGSLSER